MSIPANAGDYNLTIDRPGQTRSWSGRGRERAGQGAYVGVQAACAGWGGSAAECGSASPAAGAAQEAGSISGVIVDPTGALVARAKVTAINTDTGVRPAKVTDNTGTYSFSPLPPGPYNVEVEAKGFQRLLQENVHVRAGQDVSLNLKLTVGAAAQSLTVTGKQRRATSSAATAGCLLLYSSPAAAAGFRRRDGGHCDLAARAGVSR